MKAIVQNKYGSPDDVLELKDIDKPVVKDDEVLVRVHTASVHPDVWHLVRGLPYVLRLMGAGLLKPKNSIPGTDVAGHVVSVGKNVTQFSTSSGVSGRSIKKRRPSKLRSLRGPQQRAGALWARTPASART